MRKLTVALSLLIILVMLGGVLGWRLLTSFLIAPASAMERHAVVVVPPGARPEDMVGLLEKEGLISSRAWFEVYLRHFRKPWTVKPGEYQLSTSMSPVEILDRIDRGVVITYTVTIPQGVRASKIVAMLAQQGLGEQGELEQLLADGQLPRRLGIEGATSLEGYLFPDAYSLPKGLRGEELLGRLVARYRKEVPAEVIADAKEAGLTEHQMVTLASMIETDRVSPDERAMVSAVYHNRLKARMKLENPGTVAYGLGKETGELTAKDLGAEHPWNTYLHEGLPPTPIASPGLAAITAAARPVKSDAIYFAPRGDSTHVFCNDAVCYRLAIQRWREEQANKPRAP